MLHLINLGTQFIGDVFGNLLDWVFTTLANILPQVNPQTLPFQDAFNSVLIFAKSFSFVFPFDTLFIALGVIVSVEMIILIMKFVMWIIRLARG